MASAATTAREARGAETRRRIVEAAWHVIAERGLAGLTTRLVAAHAGTESGALDLYGRV